MTIVETKQELKKRRKKLPISESVNYTISHDSNKDGDAQDYSDIKIAWENKSEAEYNVNELIKRKADSIANRIEKECYNANPNYDTDQLREKLTHISEEIRHNFKGEANENLRNYISHILGKYKDGIYHRGYDKVTIRDPNARYSPLEDTNAKTQRLSELLEEEENTDPYDLSPTGSRDLMERHLEEYKRLREHCKDNGIEIDTDNDIDINKIRRDNARLKQAFNKLVKPDPISLEAGDPVTDEQTRMLFKIWTNKRREIGDTEYKIADQIENYPSNDPEVAKLGIKEAEARLRLIKGIPDDRVMADHEQWMKLIEERRKEAMDEIPPGREWKTKYDLENGKVKDRNPMTKDQTDIRSSSIIRDFQFTNRFIGEKALFMNWRASKHKKLKERKKKVSPKQSESA